MIKIVVDAMGGDNAPAAQVQGAIEAVNERKDIQVILVGKEDIIKQVAQKEYDENNITERCYKAMMNYKVEITD